MTDNRKPIHTRSRTGRHRVDLSQMPASVRYPLALAVLAFVLMLVVVFGGDSGVTQETMEPWAPYLGGAVIVLVLISVFLRWKGRS